MSAITQGQGQQYADSSKLAARARLHQEFTVAAEPWFPWVMARLPVHAGDAMLDIGCGPGWFWAGAAKQLPKGIDLMLADQSLGMVKEAKERCASLPFASLDGRTADAIDLPFPNDSFDVVIAMHMLYHVADQERALAEMHRVLKPGGTLAITTNGENNLLELYALTTILGSDPIDPAAMAFGYDKAAKLMGEQFGNVTHTVHPASLQITDPEVVFLALTSYPPGDTASEVELKAFQSAIHEAFEQAGGVLNVQRDTALFLSTKGD
jgi:SAM-dependent methyltransferase